MGARMAKCGCQVVRQGLEPIDFCPLHEAAESALDLLEIIAAEADRANPTRGGPTKLELPAHFMTRLRARIKLARKAAPDA